MGQGCWSLLLAERAHPEVMDMELLASRARPTRTPEAERNATHVAPVLPEGGTRDSDRICTLRKVLPRRAQLERHCVPFLQEKITAVPGVGQSARLGVRRVWAGGISAVTGQSAPRP